MEKEDDYRTFEKWHATLEWDGCEECVEVVLEMAWKAGYKAAILDALGAIDKGACNCRRDHVHDTCVHDWDDYFQDEVEGLLKD